jgi:hypothetical protein
MKVKFKEGVFGFTYDAIYGEIADIIKEPISEAEAKFFNKHANTDIVLFTDTTDVPEMFGIETDDDLNNWNDILEINK